MIIRSSGSGKTNVLLKSIKEQDDIDKMYLYAKNLNESKYGFLIKKPEVVGKTILVIQMHLLSVQIECVTFIRIRGGYRVRQVHQLTNFSFNRHNDMRL